MSTPRAATAALAEGVSRRRALATVLAVVFIDLLGFGVIIPVLPFYRDTRRVPRGLIPRVKPTRGFTFTVPGDD